MLPMKIKVCLDDIFIIYSHLRTFYNQCFSSSMFCLSNLLYTPDVKVFDSTAVFHVGTDRDRRTHILAFIFICEVKEKKNEVKCLYFNIIRQKKDFFLFF